MLFTHLKLLGLHLETRCITNWQKNINIPKSKLQPTEESTEIIEYFLFIYLTLWHHCDRFYCIEEKLWYWMDIVDPLKTFISFKHVYCEFWYSFKCTIALFLKALLSDHAVFHQAPTFFSLKEILTIALTSCIQRCIQWNSTTPKGCIIHMRAHQENQTDVLEPSWCHHVVFLIMGDVGRQLSEVDTVVTGTVLSHHKIS